MAVKNRRSDLLLKKKEPSVLESNAGHIEEENRSSVILNKSVYSNADSAIRESRFSVPGQKMFAGN